MLSAQSIAQALSPKAIGLGGGSWNTICPAHDDNSPSLTVTDGANNRILVKCHAGCTQDAVIAALRVRDLWPKLAADWRVLDVVPPNVTRPTRVAHPEKGAPSNMWVYRRRDGRLVGFSCRFELKDKTGSVIGKEILPLSYCRNQETGECAWRWKSFNKPRPLYNEHLLDEHHDRPILVVEGEKTADAAAKLFPEHLVVTWPGGGKAVRFANWVHLKERDVVIWPDADKPGIQAAERLCVILREHGTLARVVRLPDALPKGWDLADPIPPGARLDIHALLRGAEASTGTGDAVVDEFNAEFAMILLGGKAVILHEERQHDGGVAVKFMAPEAFAKFYGNKFVPLGRRDVPAPEYWMRHEERRSYRGVVFEPNKEVGQFYNLWQGFSFEPDPTGDFTMLKNHVLENICRGDTSLFNWVMGWFAQMVQHPEIKPGTSLSIIGKMGTGKTVLGEHMGALFRPHYVLVDDPRYVHGNFNAHMSSCLLLHADEAFWAGDPRNVGRLRGLVTSNSVRIEHKGKDSIEVNNYMRLIATSNNDWVVPAGFEERRFAVLESGSGRMQDRVYFAEMNRQMRSGGYEGLLHYLQTFDLSGVDIGRIPDTSALQSQKQYSLSTPGRFWAERLESGDLIPGQDSPWADAVPAEEFYDAYIRRCQQWGIQRRETMANFCKELKRLTPPGSFSEVKRTMDWMSPGGFMTRKRFRCWVLPQLDEARRHFEALLGKQAEAAVATEPPPHGDVPF